MEEIALLNPRHRRSHRVHRIRHNRRRGHARVHRTRVVHVIRRNPRRRSMLSVSGIKGIFSKQNLLNWAYLGGGFMVGVAAEKGLGEKVSSMIPFGQNIPIVNALVKQVPLIAGIALFGRSMPKSAITGMQAYIGYRLVNSALQMANINLAGLSEVDGIGYTPRFGLSGLSGIFQPISSAAVTGMSGVSDEVYNPTF